MLAELVPNIQRTAELVGDISTAMQEQSIGADQISDSITQLNDAIQKNAEFATDTSETAQELHDHSEALTEAVAYFGDGVYRDLTTDENNEPTETQEEACAA